jgi:hypothetical protein
MPNSKPKKTSEKGRTGITDHKASVIRDQLERILSSGALRVTPAQEGLLRFVVEKAISGKAHKINGYLIATQQTHFASDGSPEDLSDGGGV